MTAESSHAVTLGQILDRTVAAFPDNEAVVYVDRDFRLTYREFGDLVDRFTLYTPYPLGEAATSAVVEGIKRAVR